MIAFLLILGVSFYAIATSVINLVSDYLFQEKIDEESAEVLKLATAFAPLFAEGDTDALLAEALKVSQNRQGRLLIIDMDGKVQIDTSYGLNGWRVGHAEVVSVLTGATSDAGLHMLTSSRSSGAPGGLFDFLRAAQTGRQLVGYFTAPMIMGSVRIGVVLFSISVQPVADNLRAMQDWMLFYFLIAAVVVFAVSLIFSRVITKPIAALTEGIKRMALGDLSGRVKVGGIDEMGRLAETFNQMSEKLENLDMSRNEFVSNASHELKTPLTTMKIMLESMIYQEDMDPGLRTEFMTDINKELDRLGQIVTDLLTLVRSDTNAGDLQRKDLLLRELVRDTLHRLEPLSNENGQTIELRAQSDIPIFADPARLQQVVYNLVDNALKYSPKGGKVRVTLRQEGKQAILEVADNGPGIPKKDQPHIFDRFYRVDRARARATGGNGLGLSIVHQAVMQHGGSVSVRSEEGKGATFRVELPL